MGKMRNIRRIVTGSNQVDGAGVKLVRVLGPDTTQSASITQQADLFCSP